MTKTEKALQKHKMRKMVEEVMKSPEYLEREREMEAQWVANAIGRFAFVMCGYLETRHGYKKEGLKRFLAYLLVSMECTSDDEDFFKEYDLYYKSQYGLDVLAEIGLGLKSDPGKEQ